MSVSKRMNDNLRESVQDKLYRQERSYRADKLVDKWSKIPEVGQNIKNMKESDARNLAIHLDNQARFMGRMTESQLSGQFQNQSPENMLRLVRLSMPNTIRNKVFNEFAMESAKDSIKYVRPVYNKTASGNLLGERTFGDFNLDGDNDYNGDDYRKAMYETTEDRYVQELSNGNVIADTTGSPADAVVGGVTTTLPASSAVVVFGQVGGSGDGEVFASQGYLDGYATLFGAGGEQDVLATQSKTGGALANAGEWLVKNGVTLTITKVADGIYTLTGADAGLVTAAYARFDSESDFNGDYLGEVELVMTDYWFRPRATSIGVTWSQLFEIVMDNSFGVSSEELLVDYAGQEIKKALDFRAVKLGYQAAKMNGSDYMITFNAESGGGNDDSYLHTAQTVSQAIERVGDVMYNDILRGGVSRIVGGPAATTYLRLNSGFTTKGAQSRLGAHQVGELNGIPVFKVPSSVVPDDELLCIWKNDENEADVSIAFGTLIPFFSTGTIQRKNFYKEAGLSSYGDHALLNKKYMGIIKVTNLRQI